MGGDHKGLMFPQKKRGGKGNYWGLGRGRPLSPTWAEGVRCQLLFRVGLEKGGPPKGKEGKRGPPPHGTQRKEKSKKRGGGNETGKGKKRKVPICRIGPSICFPFFPSLSFYLFSSLTADFFLLAWVDLFFSIMQKNIGALFSPFLSVVAAAVVSGAFTVCIPPTTFPQPPSPSHESAINHIQECRGEEESNHDAISREREAGLCVVQCGWGGGN